MLLLAIAAAALMVVAPVVSRWVRASPAAHASMAMAGHAMPAMSMPMPGDPHAGHHGMMAGHGASPSSVPADPHAAHGDACDYCVMAAQLLPWLAVLLVLAPLLFRPAPQLPRAVRCRASLRWPAHPAQGPPPLFS